MEDHSTQTNRESNQALKASSETSVRPNSRAPYSPDTNSRDTKRNHPKLSSNTSHAASPMTSNSVEAQVTLPATDGCVAPQDSRTNASTSWTYRLVSAGLAFCVWGGWGYFVNSQQATAAASPVMSGLLHGLFSSMVTIVMLTSVTWLYRRFAAQGPRMLIPAATTSLATGSCITTAHLMIGTANVPATVIPGLFVAFCFNLLTTKKLSQADQTSSSCKMSLT